MLCGKGSVYEKHIENHQIQKYIIYIPNNTLHLVRQSINRNVRTWYVYIHIGSSVTYLFNYSQIYLSVRIFERWKSLTRSFIAKIWLAFSLYCVNSRVNRILSFWVSSIRLSAIKLCWRDSYRLASKVFYKKMKILNEGSSYYN